MGHGTQWLLFGNAYKGVILFPDNYTHPNGTDFTAGTYNGPSDYTATVSLEGWALMETANCVFLPAFGCYSVKGYWARASAEDLGALYSSSSMSTYDSPRNYYTPIFRNEVNYFDDDDAYCNLETRTPVRLVKTIYGISMDTDGYYLIGSVQDWNDFVKEINDGFFPTNSNARLTANIDLGNYQTMIGTSSAKYQGIFDGQGHILTMNYTTTENYYAPFRYIQGATIKNLHVAGTIHTSYRFTGGLVGASDGTSNIENCRSSVELISSYSGDAVHSGFVARIGGGTLNIKDCLFDGVLTGSTALTWGGFIGWIYDYTANINNCLFIPMSVDVGAQYSATFSGKGGTVQNSYYTVCLNNSTQGTQASDAELADGTTTAALQNSRTEVVWVQDPVTNQPMLKIFANINQDVAGYGNSTESDRWVFIASPVTGSISPTAVGNLIADPATEYDLYRFNQSANKEWENYKNPTHTESFVLENSKGYLYANKNDVTLTFIGTYNTGSSMDVNLAYDGSAALKGYNLVGNPFAQEATISMSYYKMNTDGDDIEAVAEYATTPIPAFTGVIVEATATGQHVTFTKSSGAKSGARAEKQGNLQLTLTKDGPSTGSGTESSGTVHDKAIVSFNENAQLGKYIFNEKHAKLYIPQGGKEYAIVSVSAGRDAPWHVSTNEILVNFKATEDGTYTITVNPDNVELAYLHLIDNMTGADVDLLATNGRDAMHCVSTYTFTAKTTDYESRFKLVFAAEGADGPSTGSGAFAYIHNGEIIINDADARGASLQIVDVMGRVVVSVGGHTRCVPTTGMTPGVYVLRLIDGDTIRTQKIVIE